jgi:hypothetical protein
MSLRAEQSADSATYYNGNPNEKPFDESAHDLAIQDAIDDLLDDDYEVTLTLTDFLDADHVESSLKGLINAYGLKDDVALLSVARGFASMLIDEIKSRAEDKVTG